MADQAIDIVGDQAIIRKIIEWAESKGLSASAPMPTESISDALDAPFGLEEVRQFSEIVTLIVGSGMSVVTLLKAVKELVSSTETTSGAESLAEVRRTKDQSKIATITKDTDLSQLGI